MCKYGKKSLIFTTKKEFGFRKVCVQISVLTAMTTVPRTTFQAENQNQKKAGGGKNTKIIQVPCASSSLKGFHLWISHGGDWISNFSWEGINPIQTLTYINFILVWKLILKKLRLVIKKDCVCVCTCVHMSSVKPITSTHFFQKNKRQLLDVVKQAYNPST